MIKVPGRKRKTPQELESEAQAEEAAKIAQGSGEGEDTGDAYAPVQADEEGQMLPPEDVGKDESPPLISDSGREEEPLPDEWKVNDPRCTEGPLIIEIGYYGGGLIALEGYTEDGEPFCRYSVNMGAGIPRGSICVKNWSEGEGQEQILKDAGIIEGDPVMLIPSGHVQVPVYMLTEKFRRFVGMDE